MSDKCPKCGAAISRMAEDDERVYNCGTVWPYGPANTIDDICESKECLRQQLAAAERERDEARAACARITKLAREIGPTPPNHSCGPESNCDAGCHAYAEFDAMLRKDNPGQPLLDRLARAEADRNSYHEERQELRGILRVPLPGGQGTVIQEYDPCLPLVEAAKAITERLAAQEDEAKKLRAVVRADNAAYVALCTAPELNPSNYDHDQVCELNTACTYAIIEMRKARAVLDEAANAAGGVA